MVFSSSVFLFVFLPVLLLLYYLIPKRYRNILLLMASFVFYAWAGPQYLPLILLSIAVNYFCGLLIPGKIGNLGKSDRKPRKTERDKRDTEPPRKAVLIVGIAANLTLLFYFKYFNFFLTTVNQVFGAKISLKTIALPLGVSFFTFCGISYLVDVYKGKVAAQKNPLNIALYLSFFPKVAQGPITRFGDMQNQLTLRTCSAEMFSEGVWRFTIGLAKKMAIANQLGAVVDQIYAVPADHNSASIAWLAAIGYTFQIYFDFSGYSDMAVGLGKMFGFDLMENFNYPYTAENISDFWRRWHISLSSWFRDYLYIPLGGNRTGNVYVNLFLVFVATGLWHGAAWNFVVWGLWHGIFILAERFMRNHKIELRLPGAAKALLTFFLVNLGWVLFRAPDLNYAVRLIGVMFGVVRPVDVGYTIFWYLTPKLAFVLVSAILASLPWKKYFRGVFDRFEGTRAEAVFQGAVVVALLAVSVMLVMTSTYNAFIYFKF